MNKQRMQVSQALKELASLDSKVNDRMTGTQVNTVFDSITSLEHRFDQNQPVNVIHWPAGFGCAMFLKSNGKASLRHYQKRVSKIAKYFGGIQKMLAGYKKLKNKHHNLLIFSYKLHMANQFKASRQAELLNLAVRDYVCLKFYVNKGISDPSYPYYVNMVSILRNAKTGYIHTNSKYCDILMPMTANTLHCLIDLDISNLKHTVTKDIQEAVNKAKQPKQMQLI